MLQLLEVNKGINFDDQIEPTKNSVQDLYRETNDQIIGTWINDEIEVSSGKVIGKCGTYTNVYESYRKIKISCGKLIRSESYDGESWKIKNGCEELNESNKAFLKFLHGG